MGTSKLLWRQTGKMLGGNLRWTSIPSRGSRNTPSRFILRKQEISASLMGLLARPITIGVDFIYVVTHWLVPVPHTEYLKVKSLSCVWCSYIVFIGYCKYLTLAVSQSPSATQV